MTEKPPAQYIWLDGEFVPWQEATLHVETECVKRGSNVFEGIRAYWNETEQELYLFKLAEHIARLYNSAKIMRMEPKFAPSDLIAVCTQLLIKNGLREDAALRPVVYFGIGKDYFSYTAETIHTGAYITAARRPSKLESSTGINVCVSSWARISDRDVPPRVKAGANYQNSRLAAVQASVDGYDTAILLNERGQVAEGPGACIFLVRDGIPITPSLTSGILESITRATVIDLFKKELGLETIEREVDRTELYVAEEVFFCGSAYEITPIFSIDKYPVSNGKIGKLTAKLQGLYDLVVRGMNPQYARWVHPVYQVDKNYAGTKVQRPY